jgi:hypothetical protein
MNEITRANYKYDNQFDNDRISNIIHNNINRMSIVADSQSVQFRLNVDNDTQPGDLHPFSASKENQIPHKTF